MSLNRRHFLSATAAFAAILPARALAQSGASTPAALNAADYGLISDDVGGSGDSLFDQTGALQKAVDEAARTGKPLFIPGGSYSVDTIDLPFQTTVFGVRGATILRTRGSGPILASNGQIHLVLRDLVLDGAGASGGGEGAGLISFVGCERVELSGLELGASAGTGLHLERTSGRIENLLVRDVADTGIFALDCNSLSIVGSRIEQCGNGGIRVWASGTGGFDGTLVSGNDISDIRTDGGGNGQNGNGINIYRANGVTVTGNRLRNCAFSAIRLNSTEDTIISANTCLDSGEVAIFSEFSFSGSIIAGNIVDRAALGISMTNFNEGGRLATCSGNIVRNIAPLSVVNPDTTPVGIFAEADAVISDNVVENVPGLGIGAGWGPYLRDVAITNNLVREADIGIGVSVAEGAGAVVVSGNLVSGARRAGLAGLAWTDLVSDDLARDATRFSNVTIQGNRVG